MKILFFSHFEFFNAYAVERIWMNKLVSDLETLGFQITFFKSETHIIKEFDLVHIFSREDCETWKSVSWSGVPIVVTPAIGHTQPGKCNIGGAFVTLAMHIFRVLFHRTLRPEDEITWHKVAQAYIVSNRYWLYYLEKMKRVPKPKIYLIPNKPSQAAKSIAEIYTRIISNEDPGTIL